MLVIKINMIRRISKTRSEYKDLGFGNKVNSQGGRFLNQDGSFNVHKRGLPFYIRFSFYHELINMSWGKFIWVIIGFYLVTNLVFACIYTAIWDSLTGMVYHSELERFTEAFFFSTQTFTTVGYGRVNPLGLAGNAIASLESLFGILSVALATGLLYGRFSRPMPQILYSRNGLISPYQGGAALMFRLANARKSQIIEAEIEVTVSLIEMDESGNKSRRFYILPLERKHVSFFALSWTVVHPIDSNSPFFGMSKADADESDLELMLMLKGYDTSYSQSVYSIFSYKHYDLVWDAKFDLIFSRSEDGNETILDLDRLSHYTKIDSLPATTETNAPNTNS
jgi:inward rectifier potassium channel